MQQDVDKSDKATDTDSLINWLKLAQIPKFSVASLIKLQNKRGVLLAQLFTFSSSELKKLGFKPKQVETIIKPDEARINISLDWLSAGEDRFVLYFDHPCYPEQLKQISSPPALLYGYGNPQHLSRLQIAMVGSRNPSPQGKENAKSFAHQLSECGWTITSGLALGIDGFSHQGALTRQHITIAVLGTAIDKMYPRRHIKLAEQILQNDGVIISEFAPGTPSKPENFPRRNRIISGLSQGTLIVEAAIKSGSLISARYALEQNREVFAIPGNIHNPISAGCHYLIQQGAKLVTNIQDINEEFSHLVFPSLISNEIKSQKNELQSLASDKLLDSVDFEVTPLDIVAQRSGMSVEAVMFKLLEYELCGLVSAVPGGYIKLGEK
ncbi:DNA-processing protein DprA [Paraglaciecola aquimarina]|uniref:DNA-processing protein DprA n=1 Tax=Paraglaciecola algarum TaxID=3050085 RepID=A0ABS9D3H0_9ALTE|nr:DNA-processing protein DprA [Paraglaciecola sp. G1-23]MCF2947179.1 DNA-processing protein DprA [Paraglaciecola sp. G1-23]